jgi:predicted transcriptional regulator
MKTKMLQTSLDAYDSIRRDLRPKENLVLGALIALKGKATNKEIADYLGMPINCITGRMNALVNELKVVKPGDKVKDPITGIKSQQWHFPSLHLKLL